MPNSDLEKYLEAARSRRVPEEQIKNELLRAGWPKNEVDYVFSQDANSISMPPTPIPHFGMWVAFQYIILFICLYVSFTALAGIIHHAVNKYLPDQLDKTYYSSPYNLDEFLFKGYIAGIIVTYPIFAWLFLVLKKQAIEKPAVKNLRTRKILIYMTMVITFIIMIGHLITTLYGFLGGNATTRSFAHLGVTFLVAGSVFLYLLFEVKTDRKT